AHLLRGNGIGRRGIVPSCSRMQSPSPLQQRLLPRHFNPPLCLFASSSTIHRFPFLPLHFPFQLRHSKLSIRRATPTLPGSGDGGNNQVETENREQLSIVADDDNSSRTGTITMDSGIVLSSCLVGLLTGVAVVIFNNAVHEIRDLLWDGIPYRGASWLREESIDSIWTRVILVPASGGLIVALLNLLRSSLPDSGPQRSFSDVRGRFYAVLCPVLKALSASFTLSTGNSLGPEGPSVEIGASIAKGIGSLTTSERDSKTKLSLLASGSAAGLSSGSILLQTSSIAVLSVLCLDSRSVRAGFNAAVAGCFFVVESVLWPSPSSDSSVSLSNTTSMVILSAVIASVVSEVGLGSEPAFKVPDYDFRSPSELPLYLLLGILCGLVSLALSRCTSFMLLAANNLHEAGIPRAAYHVIGGLVTGLIALAYPEILYWGFENVDILLESRPFVKGLSADLLVQLVGVKIVATSLCRASGLVGGYYAPSLFIGAATGMTYGKLIAIAVAQSHITDQLSILEVASPQAYGLVGMAATLAGVCQVPLTAVLLLFELTHDYRIVLPLLGAVGLSSWVTSGQMRRDSKDIQKQEVQSPTHTQQNSTSTTNASLPARNDNTKKQLNTSDLCEIESSLCMDDSVSMYSKPILVSQAMRTRYVTVNMSTLLSEAVRLMLEEKQSCALIVDHDDTLIGLLTLEDIENFIKTEKSESWRSQEFCVSEICSWGTKACEVPWTVKPSMDVLSAELIMDVHNLNQVPVVSESSTERRGELVGLVDRECINLTRRFFNKICK
ncbi:Chloride channel protein CLC-e, partial [Linum perenne]